MKALLLMIASVCCFGLNAQTDTDSVHTSIGDFVLITTEEIGESATYTEESITTSDGGTGEFVGASFSARFMEQAVVISEMQIALVPNPAPGVVELMVSGMTGEVNISVASMSGQTVYSSTTTVERGKQIFLPAQQWGAGTYLVVVNNGSDVKTEKLVVE